MGLERTIHFPARQGPSWDAIREHLRRVGEDPLIRMIDGLPAFPDEIPPDGWAELRLGMTAGMVTLRRAPGAFTCVIWGNADVNLAIARDRVCWACAAAGEGRVDTPSGPLPAASYAQSAGLFPA